MVLWLATRKKKSRYWAYTTSLKLHRNCQLSSCPLCFLQWLLDRNGFMDRAAAVWSQGYGRAGHVGSHHLTFHLLRFVPGPTPAPHRDTQTVSVPAAVLHSAINILIAVLFRLLGQALYFLKKKKDSASALTFPFAETQQSFIHHTTECKISKLFDITGLMKWLALLYCYYSKRSAT